MKKKQKILMTIMGEFNMEILKNKLTSRKLWAAILAVLVVMSTIVFGNELTPELVSALECVVFAAIAYIFGEGAVDVARVIAEAIKKAYEMAKQNKESVNQNGDEDTV